jgi:serine/threonine protein kinase
MGSLASERDPVEELAEEFVERYRRGERPTLKEYIDRYPEGAEKIRALFPALLMLEQARPDPIDATGPDRGPRLGDARLERLGEYRILREVGRGGMGVVYEAEQESLGRHVALKVLAAHTVLDPRHLERFRREARAAARLHHTNIVPVHGVGEQDGLHYYVMQFIQGLGLDEVLAELKRLRQARRGPAPGPADGPRSDGDGGSAGGLAAEVAHSLLTGQYAPDHRERGDAAPTSSEACPPAAGGEQGPSAPANRSGSTSAMHLPGQAEGTAPSESGSRYWASVARIGAQVAEALAYAWSQGVLHRDIKPSNLLLDTGGIVWVTDFGLAKTAADTDNLTHTGDVVGTLRYMAPERFSGQADVRSDVYALGLTLYELLTLRPAFDAGDRDRLIAQVLHDDPPRPRRLDPTIPHDLETIVLKATARDPAQRYQTPAELGEDLQRFLDDRPIKARRQGLVRSGWRWCRRNPALAALSAAVIALVLTVAVGSTLAMVRLQAEQGQARAQLDRAENAERQARDRLWDARLAEAHARRWSGQPGRHFKGLQALTEAATIRTSLELRNEAVACIPLVDLRVARRWPLQPGQRLIFEPSLERYALVNKGIITIHGVG